MLTIFNTMLLAKSRCASTCESEKHMQRSLSDHARFSRWLYSKSKQTPRNEGISAVLGLIQFNADRRGKNISKVICIFRSKHQDDPLADCEEKTQFVALKWKRGQDPYSQSALLQSQRKESERIHSNRALKHSTKERTASGHIDILNPTKVIVGYLRNHHNCCP